MVFYHAHTTGLLMTSEFCNKKDRDVGRTRHKDTRRNHKLYLKVYKYETSFDICFPVVRK